MKPSSLLSQESPLLFDNNVNFIQSSDWSLIASFQLSLISNYIDQEKKSYIFISNKDETKDTILKLLAIRMGCSLRNVKNPTYISSRENQYNKELSLIDRYVVVINDMKSFDVWTSDSKLRKDVEGCNFFFLDINNGSFLNNISFLKPDIYVRDHIDLIQIILRCFCRMSSILKVKIFLGTSNNTTDIGTTGKSVVADYVPDGVFLGFFSLNKNNLIDLNNSHKKYFLTNSHEKIGMNSDFEFKVDPETGLFYQLQDEDVLKLKDLLITLSRNKDADIWLNEYLIQWLLSYKNGKYRPSKNDDSDILHFISKVYLSIANKLEIKE